MDKRQLTRLVAKRAGISAMAAAQVIETLMSTVIEADAVNGLFHLGEFVPEARAPREWLVEQDDACSAQVHRSVPQYH